MIEHKVHPPFPALYSFHISAIILSYWRYKDDVQSNLNLLSKKAGLYYLAHAHIIKAFLSDVPELTSTLDFGWED